MGHFARNGTYFSLNEIAHGPSSTLQIAAPWKTDACETKVSPEMMLKSGDIEMSFEEVADADVCGEHDADVCGEEVSCASEDFAFALGTVLSQWVEVTASSETQQEVGRFHSVRAPSMSIIAYLERIKKYFYSSDECFVIALVYIDRIGKMSPSMTLCELNVHRLVVTAVMVAAKFHDDIYYSNKYYGKVAGLGIKEMNALEATMLKMLDFKVFVSPEEYQLYHNLVYKATGYGRCDA
jgi:hypothetical protein